MGAGSSNNNRNSGAETRLSRAADGEERRKSPMESKERLVNSTTVFLWSTCFCCSVPFPVLCRAVTQQALCSTECSDVSLSLPLPLSPSPSLSSAADAACSICLASGSSFLAALLPKSCFCLNVGV